MNMTILCRLSLIILSVSSIFLGVSYFNYNHNIQSSDEISKPNGVLSNLTLLRNSNDQLYQQIALDVEELDKTLRFMVWPDERLKLLRQTVLLTQKLINHQPTEAKHWKRLLNLQYELAPESVELSWILDKIYKLEGWNNRELINLSRYCVPFAFNNQMAAPSACNAIINHLPGQNEKAKLARQVGVSEADLEIVLSRY